MKKILSDHTLMAIARKSLDRQEFTDSLATLPVRKKVQVVGGVEIETRLDNVSGLRTVRAEQEIEAEVLAVRYFDKYLQWRVYKSSPFGGMANPIVFLLRNFAGEKTEYGSPISKFKLTRPGSPYLVLDLPQYSAIESNYGSDVPSLISIGAWIEEENNRLYAYGAITQTQACVKFKSGLTLQNRNWAPYAELESRAQVDGDEIVYAASFIRVLCFKFDVEGYLEWISENYGEIPGQIFTPFSYPSFVSKVTDLYGYLPQNPPYTIYHGWCTELGTSAFLRNMPFVYPSAPHRFNYDTKHFIFAEPTFPHGWNPRLLKYFTSDGPGGRDPLFPEGTCLSAWLFDYRYKDMLTATKFNSSLYNLHFLDITTGELSATTVDAVIPNDTWLLATCRVSSMLNLPAVKEFYTWAVIDDSTFMFGTGPLLVGPGAPVGEGEPVPYGIDTDHRVFVYITLNDFIQFDYDDHYDIIQFLYSPDPLNPSGIGDFYTQPMLNVYGWWNSLQCAVVPIIVSTSQVELRLLLDERLETIPGDPRISYVDGCRLQVGAARVEDFTVANYSIGYYTSTGFVEVAAHGAILHDLCGAVSFKIGAEGIPLRGTKRGLNQLKEYLMTHFSFPLGMDEAERTKIVKEVAWMAASIYDKPVRGDGIGYTTIPFYATFYRKAGSFTL